MIVCVTPGQRRADVKALRLADLGCVFDVLLEQEVAHAMTVGSMQAPASQRM